MLDEFDELDVADHSTEKEESSPKRVRIGGGDGGGGAAAPGKIADA